MTESITRAQLLRRGATGGAAILVAGASLGVLAEAAKAEPLSDNDLAYARLLVGLELLGSDFYERALAAEQGGPKLRKFFKRAVANEKAHYTSVGQVLSGAGFTPAAASDLDYTYPSATFSGQRALLRFSIGLEELMLGTYLGAARDVQSAVVRAVIARIASSEAMHVSYLAILTGRDAFPAFPQALTIEQASNALEAYIV